MTEYSFQDRISRSPEAKRQRAMSRGVLPTSIYNNEEKIIIQALLEFGIDQDNIQQIISEGKKIESNSNQILEFTKEVKKMNNDYKIKIVETLWRIIYSNKEADVYETSLMRRLAGLLYIDSKVMGDIKEKIIKEIK